MSKYNAEVQAIRELREAYPLAPRRTLAMKIRLRGFDNTAHNARASLVGMRPYLSIYSVIRRYDAAKAKAVAA